MLQTNRSTFGLGPVNVVLQVGLTLGLVVCVNSGDSGYELPHTLGNVVHQVSAFVRITCL